jgi:hypothetical protein
MPTISPTARASNATLLMPRYSLLRDFLKLAKDGAGQDAECDAIRDYAMRLYFEAGVH